MTSSTSAIERRKYWLLLLLKAQGVATLLFPLTHLLCTFHASPFVLSIVTSEFVVFGYFIYRKRRFGDAVSFVAAARSDDLTEAQRLLSRGVSPSAADADGTTALHSCRSETMARNVLSAGADPNAAMKGTGLTPLYTTTHSEVAAALLEHGADPNATPTGMPTLLWHHHSQGHDRIVQLLVEHGANINLPSAPCQMTLLHTAQTTVQAQELLTLGADPNVPTGPVYARNDGQISSNLYPFTERHHVRGLLIRDGPAKNEKGYPIDFVCDGGATPLHYAVCRDNHDLAQLLLDRGASPSAQDVSGATPLHYVQSGNLVELLVRKGSNPNARMVAEPTPLHLAVLFLRIDVVAALLAAGADPNALSAPLRKLTVTGLSWTGNTTTWSYADTNVRFLPIIFPTVSILAETHGWLYKAFRHPAPVDLSTRFPSGLSYTEFKDSSNDLSRERRKALEEEIRLLLLRAGSRPFDLKDWKNWRE